MTNPQKAQRLEEMAAYMAENGLWSDDAPLLRESAAMWRERNPDDALWELEYQRRYKRIDLCVIEGFTGQWQWSATRNGAHAWSGWEHTLPAAQSAAMAWVDAQEGKP